MGRRRGAREPASVSELKKKIRASGSDKKQSQR